MDSSNADVRLVVVYRTQNLALWGMAKSILDAAPVEYWTRGETLLNLGQIRSRSDLDVEFLVKEGDAEWVRELLVDLTPASGQSGDS